MGLMRFVVENRQFLTEARLARAYVTGMDEVASFGRAVATDQQLVIERDESDSGCFAIPWPVASHGDWLLATASLMERERPYLLEVELARGLVFRLRDQFSVWELLGLEVPAELRDQIAETIRRFSRAATRQSDRTESARLATEAIDLAADAACKLAHVYADQAIALRRSSSDRLGTLLGVTVAGEVPPKSVAKRLGKVFNMISTPCGWGSIEQSEGERDWSDTEGPLEWAYGAGLRVCCGPLIEFDDRRLPDWAYLWEGDFDTLASLMIGHVRATVERFKGRVHLWNVASRINREGVLSLSDEQRLQIVAGAVRAVRQLDPQTPVVVSLDQPWGEYRARSESALAPLDFADALERADLGIAGFHLELNIGFHPFSTALRNPLAFSRLIDIWNVRIEAPLMLSLTLPSTAEEAPLADPRVQVVASEEQPELLTPEWQAEWARERLPLLLAKNVVQVLVWGQLTDANPHCWPNGGLFDSQGNEKPLLGVLQELRKEYLA